MIFKIALIEEPIGGSSLEVANMILKTWMPDSGDVVYIRDRYNGLKNSISTQCQKTHQLELLSESLKLFKPYENLKEWLNSILLPKSDTAVVILTGIYDKKDFDVLKSEGYTLIRIVTPYERRVTRVKTEFECTGHSDGEIKDLIELASSVNEQGYDLSVDDDEVYDDIVTMTMKNSPVICALDIVRTILINISKEDA